METLTFEFPRMVPFTPPGGDATEVSSIVIVGATACDFGAEGVAIETDEGATVVPYGFTSFMRAPFVHRAPGEP